MDIHVKQEFSETDAKKADLARAQFLKPRSNVDGVLNAADTKTTVCLCEDHDRAFAHPSVLSQYGYRKFDRFPYCMANCDYCGIFDKCQVYTHESIFTEVWQTRDERRRAIATASVVR